MPQCEACGEAATRQDCEGIWLCDADYQHLLLHWRLLHWRFEHLVAYERDAPDLDHYDR